MGVLQCGQDGAFAVTESDGIASTFADASEHDGVAVEQELPLLACWELDWLLAAPAEL